MREIMREINKALEAATAAERLCRLLAIEGAGLPGAFALRSRQQRIRDLLRGLGLSAERDSLRDGPCRPGFHLYPHPAAVYSSRQAAEEATRDRDHLVQRVSRWSHLPVRCSPREAYRALRHQDRQGIRDRRLEAERAARRAKRLARLTEQYTQVVAARRGETEIVGQYQTETLAAVDTRGSLVVLHCEGWRQYSSRFGARRASLSYLAGTDDSGRWAVRIPGTITTVGDALEWVEPAEVRRARSVGRRVLRQGDLYAVETTAAHDGGGSLPQSHTWDPVTRILSHGKHRPMAVPYPARFVRQRVYRMGRTARRGAGD